MKVLRLSPRGILAAGLPCGSWVWMNRKTSGRSKHTIFGSTRHRYIREANVSFGALGTYFSDLGKLSYLCTISRATRVSWRVRFGTLVNLAGAFGGVGLSSGCKLIPIYETYL